MAKLTTQDNYNKTLINRLENSVVEQELERLLVSDEVEIMDTTQKQDKIYYLVSVDESQIYIVLYEMKGNVGFLGKYYKWVYVSNRLVGIIG